MSNYHPEYKPACKLANARIAELEADKKAAREDAEYAQAALAKVTAERDAAREVIDAAIQKMVEVTRRAEEGSGDE